MKERTKQLIAISISGALAASSAGFLAICHYPVTVKYNTYDTHLRMEDERHFFGDKLKEPVAPNRIGYKLTGYYTTEMDQWNFKTNRVYSDMTLNLSWTPIIYNISYHLNGGDNDSDNPSWYCIESKIFLEPAYKYGYTFGGWYTDEACVGRQLNTVWGRTGDLDLYAKWNKITREITLHYNCPNREDEKFYGDFNTTVYLQSPYWRGHRLYYWTETNSGYTYWPTDGVTQVYIWQAYDLDFEAQWVIDDRF